MHHTYPNNGNAAVLDGATTLAIYRQTLKKIQTSHPPSNGPTHTECRILKHVVASAAEAEAGGLFHSSQTSVPLHITLNELGFTQPTTQIKTNNYDAEGIVNATVRQKISKEMDM